MEEGRWKSVFGRQCSTMTGMKCCRETNEIEIVQSLDTKADQRISSRDYCPYKPICRVRLDGRNDEEPGVARLILPAGLKSNFQSVVIYQP